MGDWKEYTHFHSDQLVLEQSESFFFVNALNSCSILDYIVIHSKVVV